jgi:hypothetical protein
MQEPTPSPNQDKNWYEKNLLGILTYLPTYLEFALLRNKTQVCGVQASLHNCSLTKSYHGVVVGVSLMFLVSLVFHSF